MTNNISKERKCYKGFYLYAAVRGFIEKISRSNSRKPPEKGKEMWQFLKRSTFIKHTDKAFWKLQAQHRHR